MEHHTTDEDNLERLRLAALMTLKKKLCLPINTGSSKSVKGFQPILAYGCNSQSRSYNTPARNNGRWFPRSNKSHSKDSLRHGCFQKSTHSNSNLIPIIPSDSIECDSHTYLTNSVLKDVNSTLGFISEDKKSSDTHNLNIKVSTKFSRLEQESDSEESDDDLSEKHDTEDTDDCDIISLGDKDKDLDNLDKLMDIMEAEMTSEVGETSIKENTNLKTKKKNLVKHATELNPYTNVPVIFDQPKIVESSNLKLNKPKEELKMTKTSEKNSNIQSFVVLRSLPLSNKKRSISPFTKHTNYPNMSCSTTIEQSGHRHISISPSLSPIREKIPSLKISPLSPEKKPYNTLSQVVLPNLKDFRQIFPLCRKSRSPLKRKSEPRSPKTSPAIKKKYSSTSKLIRSRKIPHTIQCVDNKILDNDHLQKIIKVKSVEKQVEMKPINPIVKVKHNKKLSIQHPDFVDLRIEIERRKALRLNMNQCEVDEKKKSEPLYPTRLLQTAIKDVVGSSSDIKSKRKKCSYKPEIIVQTEGNSSGRRVILISENENHYNDKLESYASIKRLKGDFKKIPLHLWEASGSNNNTKRKGLNRIFMQNINITDTDQM